MFTKYYKNYVHRTCLILFFLTQNKDRIYCKSIANASIRKEEADTSEFLSSVTFCETFTMERQSEMIEPK